MPLLAGVSAVATLAIVGGVLVANRGGDEPTTVEPTTVEPTVVAQPTVESTVPPLPRKIDPATITAIASSTLPDEPTYNFSVSNTIDGDVRTAWNDGAPGAGEGERLTYRFQTSVRLTTVKLVNGWVATQRLFEINARMRDIVIVTDAGRFPVTLADHMEPQQFDRDFGRTTSVVIEVVSVYPGTTFEDLALSEIELFGLP